MTPHRQTFPPASSKHQPPAAWYRQFWPWFLIVLPGAVIAASVATIVIALRHGDQLVVDDYYREGLAINRQLAEDRLAATLALTADIHVTANGDITLQLQHGVAAAASPVDHLNLRLQHPTEANLDRQLVLSSQGSGQYRGHFAVLPEGRWYLTLSPINVGGISAGTRPAEPIPAEANTAAPDDGDEGQWRLKAEVDFHPNDTLHVSSNRSNKADTDGGRW